MPGTEAKEYPGTTGSPGVWFVTRCETGAPRDGLAARLDDPDGQAEEGITR
jgi:hypothetical protein